MRPDRKGRGRAALALLRAVARLVPRGERRAWLEEWEGELAVLIELACGSPCGARAPGQDESGRGDSSAHYPRPVMFVLGAIPHAFWMRKEGWTMEGMIQDLRLAFRTLARSPGFTVTTTLTLALGIGANATIFSLVNGLVLRDPPGIDRPDRLVQIARSYEDAPRWDNWSWPALRTIRERGAVFEDVAGHASTSVTLGTGPTAAQVEGLLVTGNYFTLLGVRPAVGRLIGPRDDVTPGAHPVAVLSHGLWQTAFGGDPAIVGDVVQVAGRAFEVIGVAPSSFGGTSTLGARPGIFLPASMHPGSRGRLPFEEWGWSWIEGVGRLADGVGLTAARSAMSGLGVELSEVDPVNDGLRVLLARGVGLDPDSRRAVERMSLLLTGVALLVLLLTCANAANLFVARATTRQGEMGVRAALGAGRARLARQLVTESLLLGVLAAVVAIGPLSLGVRALPTLLPVAVSVPLGPDVRVFGALVALGILSGLLFGAVPSWVAARKDLVGAIRGSGTSGATGPTRLRDALVVGQLSLSLGLLAAAMLLGSSVLGALRADPGFDPDGLVAAYMDLEGTGRYDLASAADFGERLAERARSLPGARSAAVASQAPFLGGFNRATRAPAERPADPSVEIEAEAVFVSTGYFETMGIPVLRGRAIRASSQEPEPVAVVSETLARRFWPDEDPIGRYLTGETELRVVGVVGDVQTRTLRAAAAPAVYQPLRASFTQRLAVVVRSDAEVPRVAGAVRDLVADLDPGLPVLAIADVQSRMAASLGTTRTIGMLVTAFAGLALLLSAVGLYGLVSFGVSRRIREMGIRIALGAGPGTLVRLVLRRVLGLTALGLLGGLVLAVGLGHALQDVLYGVGAADPAALALATAVLLGAAVTAAWLPARRAGRVDAATSLRQ